MRNLLIAVTLGALGCASESETVDTTIVGDSTVVAGAPADDVAAAAAREAVGAAGADDVVGSGRRRDGEQQEHEQRVQDDETAHVHRVTHAGRRVAPLTKVSRSVRGS